MKSIYILASCLTASFMAQPPEEQVNYLFQPVGSIVFTGFATRDVKFSRQPFQGGSFIDYILCRKTIRSLYQQSLVDDLNDSDFKNAESLTPIVLTRETDSDEDALSEEDQTPDVGVEGTLSDRMNEDSTEDQRTPSEQEESESETTQNDQEKPEETPNQESSLKVTEENEEKDAAKNDTALNPEIEPQHLANLPELPTEVSDVATTGYFDKLLGMFCSSKLSGNALAGSEQSEQPVPSIAKTDAKVTSETDALIEEDYAIVDSEEK